MNTLIVVDMQYDFLPKRKDFDGKMIEGALPVPGGDQIIQGINNLMQDFEGMIVLTQDWHPWDHSSFTQNGGPWPTHCVQGFYGSWLAVHDKYAHAIVRKGYRKDADSYSGFKDANGKETGLYGLLRYTGQRDTIFVCGLAKDFCVKATAEDALILCPDVRIIDALTKPVFPEKLDQTNLAILERGIKLV